MNLSRGERERLKQLFNTFLAAQRRCSETTEIGRLKKHVYAALVVAFGFVLGDDGQFEKNIQLWLDEILEFNVIKDSEINPENN